MTRKSYDRMVLAMIIGGLLGCLVAFVWNPGNAFAYATGPSDCPVCQTIPATKTETVNQSTVQITSTNTVESKTVKSKIRHYEQSKHVIVAIHMRAGGVKSKKGCVDPTKPVKDKKGKKSKPWIQPGQPFINTRKNGPPFVDTWEKGRKICNPVRVHIGSRWYMKGTKDNCENKGILIPIAGPKLVKQTKTVEAYKSYKEFLAVYTKWTTSTTTTTTTPDVKVSYSCPDSTWTLNSDHTCTKCEHQECTPIQASITITTMTSLNMIAAGKTSGPFHVTVNASQAGGSLTVDPGIGAVSRCDSTVPSDHVTFTGLTSGDNDECVILYAPNDADKPASMTATFTAILGSAKDVKSDTFAITYPTRPS